MRGPVAVRYYGGGINYYQINKANTIYGYPRISRGTVAITTAAAKRFNNKDNNQRLILGRLETFTSPSGVIIYPENLQEMQLGVRRLQNESGNYSGASLIFSSQEETEVNGWNLPSIFDEIKNRIRLSIEDRYEIDFHKQIGLLAKFSLFLLTRDEDALLIGIAEDQVNDISLRWVAALIQSKILGVNPLIYTDISERKGIFTARASFPFSTFPAIEREFPIEKNEPAYEAAARAKAKSFLDNLPYLIVDREYYII
jgi:hypothetical protein